MTTIVCDGNFMIADHRISLPDKTSSKFLKRNVWGANRFNGGFECKENSAKYSFSDSGEKIIDFRNWQGNLTFGNDSNSKIIAIGFSGNVSASRKLLVRLENLSELSKDINLKKALPLLLDKCLNEGEVVSMLILLEDGMFYKVGCNSNGTSTTERGDPGETLMIGSGSSFLVNTPFSLKEFSSREIFTISTIVDTYSSQSYSVFSRQDNVLYLTVFPEPDFIKATWIKFLKCLGDTNPVKRNFNFYTGLNNPY